MKPEFDIIRGDSNSVNVSIKDSNGVIIDITDTFISFTAKKKLTDSDADAILKKTVKDIITPEDGMINIDFSYLETKDLKPGVYYWDIQFEKDGIITSTPLKKLRVASDVKRGVS